MSRIGNFPAAASLLRWLEAGIFDAQVFAETEVGFPQGGIISPLLMNIALHGLQSELGIKLRPSGIVRSDGGSGRHYCRYADDFVVLTKTRDDALVCVKIISDFMSIRGLTLKKSQIYYVTQPFVFGSKGRV